MDEAAGISKLPEPILHHILSFLPQDREAVRTCVLSKSWRHLGSTRPNFCLKESYFGEDKEKFKSVLEKSLQVYSDQKLSIKDFYVWPSMVDPELVSLLENWIPKVIHDMSVKIFNLSFISKESAYFDLPDVVFESESLQELYLQRCNLRPINSIFGNKPRLKTLHLEDVNIEEETFAKIMSSCTLIEDLYLLGCKGFTTIKMHIHHILKVFKLDNIYGRSIEIYLPSTIGDISIKRCPNWFHHRNYFPGLTCLILEEVPLSHEWFNSFSRNFPCLKDLELLYCDGVDEFQISSLSIERLRIGMARSTIKATIDTPSIKLFSYGTFISQCISFSSSSTEWSSYVHLYKLDFDDSQLFLKLSGFVNALSRSQIKYLLVSDLHNGNHVHIEHLFDFSVCCSGSCKMPVAIGILEFNINGLYYDSFFSDLMNGLFRIIRPREIKPFWYGNKERPKLKKNEAFHEFLCRTLQLGRLEEDEGMSFWQQDLEEVSLEVRNGSGSEKWRPVEGTINWSEYVVALLPPLESSSYEFRFHLKWRE